jgi:hypothetical protein
MSSPLSAQPLKVTASGSSSKGGDQGGSGTPVASRGSSPRPPKPLTNPADISSPHELTAFVRSASPPYFFSSVHGMTEEHFRWKRYWSNLTRSSTTCLRKSSTAVRCHVPVVVHHLIWLMVSLYACSDADVATRGCARGIYPRYYQRRSTFEFDIEYTVVAQYNPDNFAVKAHTQRVTMTCKRGILDGSFLLPTG